MAQAKQDTKSIEQKLTDASRDDAPATPAAATPGTIDTIEYRPDLDVALPEAGDIALENWVGRVGNRRVRVYRGARAKKIPAEVIKAMAASECHVGRVTWHELGLRPPVDTDRRVRAPAADRSGGF